MLALHPVRIRGRERREEVRVGIQRRRSAGDVADFDVINLEGPGARDDRSDADVAQGVAPENFQPEVEAVGVKGTVVDHGRRRNDELPRGREVVGRGRAEFDAHRASIGGRHLDADLQVIVESEIKVRTARQRGETHRGIVAPGCVAAHERAPGRREARHICSGPTLQVADSRPFPEHGARQSIRGIDRNDRRILLRVRRDNEKQCERESGQDAKEDHFGGGEKCAGKSAWRIKWQLVRHLQNILIECPRKEQLRNFSD